MAFFEQGSRVWFKVQEKNIWVPATTGGSDGRVTAFKGDDKQEYSMANAEIGPTTVTSMHESSQKGVEDMATLVDLHEAAILYNIRLRYAQLNIYTYIGSILSAVNPYKELGALYSDTEIAKYNKKALGELPPHIFAIANEAYYAMWKSDFNQVVLISGESGAGKTESTKFIMRYLSNLSNQVHGSSGAHGDRASFEDQILQCNPILEAFGNAKTVYNNNSSRFGKYLRVSFSSSGTIEGGRIIDYLLEKNRVVRQNAGERNFHIFFQLLTAPSDPKLKLKPKASDYFYLNQTGILSDKAINDTGDWQRVQAAMTTMGFSDQERLDVLSVLAAILHLGNLTFTQNGGAQIGNENVLQVISDLLAVDSSAMAESLTSIKRELRGEVITTPLEIREAADSRDSLAMALYAQLFKWIVSKLNVSLKGSDTFHSIGVLDIFGFENFEVNSFEQFNINYANEKLQQYFNRHIFSLEQLEYTREGINWAEIEWIDNAECLDLVERKLGILSLFDEESRFPKGTDDSLLIKLHGNANTSGFYIKPRVANGKFGIRHYAGEVHYEVKGFLEKNRDTFRDDFFNMLQQSGNDFIYDLFESLDAARGSGGNTARKKATVSSQFKESLTHLMTTLSQSNPYFVRCLKPNMQKVPDRFDSELVLNQLRYSGMLETVRIRRAGYPVRRVFDDFLYRYRVLGTGLAKALEVKDKCAAVMKKYDPTCREWQIGTTKVFYREGLETVLERRRQEELRVTIMKIQAVILGYAQRKRYRAIRAAIISIQAWWRMHFNTRRYKKKRHATIVLQSAWRGRVARKLRAELAEKKRQEEERRRQEELRRAEERRREMERLERLAREAAEREAADAQAQLEAARRAAEEEVRREAEERERKKVEAEQKMKVDLERVRQLEDQQRVRDEEAKRREEENARLKEEEKRAAELAEIRRKEEVREKAEREAIKKEQDELRRRDLEEQRMEEAEEGGASSAVMLTDEPAIEGREGYLGMFRGVLNNLKRRWCVLHDGTFMWFKAKQDSIKAGWLTKMGGGTSTLGRKNWKRRYMTLKFGELAYLTGEEEGAEQKGVVDILTATEISPLGEDFDKKSNVFQIVTNKRTYFMYADSPEEMAEWIEVLNSVRGKSLDQLKEMMAMARVDARNAQGSIELDEILSCGPDNRTDMEGHPMFVVMTADQLFKFVSPDAVEMNEWIRVLAPKKRTTTSVDDESVKERGWLLKAGGKDGVGLRRRRWFVLRGDVISYYRQKDDDLTVGSIPLNSLCSVMPPDEAAAAEKNEWTFLLHSRHKSYHLTALTQPDCSRWVNAIQDVIENAPTIETPTEKLIEQLKSIAPSQVENMYEANKILTFTPECLRSPLLPLQYGDANPPGNTRAYGTLQDEALKVFASLCPIDPTRPMPRHGNPSSPIEMIKSIVQACFDLPKLRNEVYCQIIKQTTNAPNVGGPANLAHWYLLATLCNSFLPSRKFVRYLRFHLRRSADLPPEQVGADAIRIANYCMECIKRTKTRDFPPSTREIEAIINGKALVVTVNCVGGRAIDIPVTSSTTCGEVIAFVKKELGLQRSRNGFGLFESCGLVDKYLEDKYMVADVISKWEKYEAHGINPDGDTWKLVFKLFAFFDPLARDLSKTEQEFLFEQAFESVMARRFPADDDTLVKLAALRVQYVVGDYEDGAYISDLIRVHPAQQEQLLPSAGATGPSGTLKKAGTMIKGTLRGLGLGTIKKLTGSIKRSTSSGSVTSEPDIAKVKEAITGEWKKLRGLDKDATRQQYMEIIQAWEGYGANLFEVEQTSNKMWPNELWLAISLQGVGVFERGKPKRLAFYRYETVLSFGAPVANKYKIMVDNVGSMLFDTNMVLEIAKLMKEYIKEIVTRRR